MQKAFLLFNSSYRMYMYCLEHVNITQIKQTIAPYVSQQVKYVHKQSIPEQLKDYSTQ